MNVPDRPRNPCPRLAWTVAVAVAGLAFAVNAAPQDDEPTPVDLPARRPAPSTQPAMTPPRPREAAPNAPTATEAPGTPGRDPGTKPAGLPSPDAPPAPDHDDGETLWPQSAAVDGRTYVLYAPQFEALDAARATARAAFSIAEGAGPPVFGTCSFDAAVDHDGPSGAIILSGVSVQRATLADGRNADAAATELQSMLDGARFTCSRAGVMRNMRVAAGLEASTARLPDAPPAIKVVRRRATLLLLDGAPVLRPVGDGSVGIAQNAASLLAYDSRTRTWFTRSASGDWLVAPSFRGPYTPADGPAPDARAAIEQALPPRHVPSPAGRLPASAPAPDRAPARGPAEVIVSTEPTCLVSIDGGPRMVRVADGVRAVSNAGCDLFADDAGTTWWLLASGRWFSTADLDAGPWARVAPADLPRAFASIDPHGPWGNVLASVPGTVQATNALYQQGIVHLSTLDRGRAKATLSLLGNAPRMRAIEGTSMRYASNASDPLINCDGRWYLCESGAWFASDAAGGPWSLCDSLPESIGAIPPTCPVYPATFVEVYGSTPDTVTFGFTAGYMNSFVSEGSVVWGTGASAPGSTDQGDVPAADGVSDPTWGPYAGWPFTYGSWPSYGTEYGGWNFAPVPGWADAGLWCGPSWCGSGWWGPGWGFCNGYALGLGFADAWSWGYHPWGWRDGSGWWNNHWQGAHRRAWDDAMTDANRAARAGAHGSIGAAARTDSGWRHAAGSPNDVYAGRDGRVLQRRADGTYRREGDAWQRTADDGSARADAGAGAAEGDARAGDGAGRTGTALVERDPGVDAHAAARDPDADAAFRPDPNHNFDGSPRGAFARGETNYADRQDSGSVPRAAPPAEPGDRAGAWNGGGWERGGWGVSDQYGTYAQRWGNDYDRGIPGFNQDTGWYDRTVSRPVNPYGYNYTGWSNGYRGYGSLSGWEGARGGAAGGRR